MKCVLFFNYSGRRLTLFIQVEQNEIKTDAKIDLLHQSGLIGSSPVKKTVPMSARMSGAAAGTYPVSKWGIPTQ